MENILTDREAIRKALCFPKSIPDSFIPKELVPVGSSKFKGDKMPKYWSVNKLFTVGETYPIYEMIGENTFVVGSDGVGKKMTPVAWTKIKYF